MTDPAILAAVIDEWRRRHEAGEANVLQELQTRHPEIADVLSDEVARLQSFETRGRENDSTVVPAGPFPAISPEDAFATQVGDGTVRWAGKIGRDFPVAFGDDDRYRVLDRLGSGAFGDVYLCRDERLHRDVAIKVPRPSWLQARGNVAEFLHEARAVAALTDPGIVTMHDVIEEPNGTIYVVMEYVAGGTLQSQLDRLPSTTTRMATLGAGEIARIGCEIAMALVEPHQRKVVHRDLKPANVLVGEGRLRITDFGLAISTDASASSAMAGTPAYMSPEQLATGPVPLDGRSDIWSIGVILYQAATGQLPFVGGERPLFDAIRKDAPVDPRKIDKAIPVSLQTIILRCLEKNPNDRYQSVQDLANDLRPLTVTTHGGCRWEWVAIPVGAFLCFGGFSVAVMGFTDMVSTAYLSTETMREVGWSNYLSGVFTLGLGPPLIAMGNWCCCRRSKAIRANTPTLPCRVSRWAIACAVAGCSTGGFGPWMWVVTVVLAIVAMIDLNRKRRWLTGQSYVVLGVVLATILGLIHYAWWQSYDRLLEVTGSVEVLQRGIEDDDQSLVQQTIALLDEQTAAFPASAAAISLVPPALEARWELRQGNTSAAIERATQIIEESGYSPVAVPMAYAVRRQAYLELGETELADKDANELGRMDNWMRGNLPAWVTSELPE